MTPQEKLKFLEDKVQALEARLLVLESIRFVPFYPSIPWYNPVITYKGNTCSE